MTEIKFGTAGHSTSFTGRTVDAAAWISEKGLTAFEVQCGRGVKMSEETARSIGKAMALHNISLSVHSPYFISLSNPERQEGNINYIRQSCKLAQFLNAPRVVVHMGAVQGLSREIALEQTIKNMGEIIQTSRAEGWDDITLCVETMGKINQMGTLTEVIALCKQYPSLLPCIDFGHLYARSFGECNGIEAIGNVFDEMEHELGFIKSFHIHFSCIEFTKGGEKRHLSFENKGEFGPDWKYVAQHLANRGYTPTIICESDGTQAEDAVEMMNIYNLFMEKPRKA